MKSKLIHTVIMLIGLIGLTMGCATSSVETSSQRVSEVTEASLQKYRLNFEAASLDTVLEFYENISGRTLLMAPGIPDVEITLKADSLTNKEALYAVEESLSLHGINLVVDGTEFVKAIPIHNK